MKLGILNRNCLLKMNILGCTDFSRVDTNFQATERI